MKRHMFQSSMDYWMMVLAILIQYTSVIGSRRVDVLLFYAYELHAHTHSHMD